MPAYRSWGYNEDGSSRDPETDFAMPRAFGWLSYLVGTPIFLLFSVVWAFVLYMGW